MTRVEPATNPAQLDAVRGLMRDFPRWHRNRHVEDLARIERYFDAAACEAERAGLPRYAPPRGRLLLATLGDRPAGCVALHALEPDVCEMKCMFVPPALQGRGVGGALARRLLEEARALGYRAMRLDTSVRQAEALALYRRLGFEPIEPYDAPPPDLRDGLVFMELRL
jgi:GNAT superfamily N-acetyltransferase